MVARGLLAGRHASTRPGSPRCSARPRVHRVLWFTLWSAAAGTALSVALGLPAAYALHRLRPARAAAWSGRCCWCRSCCRPSWSGWRSGSCSRDGGPLGFLGLDQTAGGHRRRPGLLQRRRRGPRGRRVLGVARPAAGPGRGDARRDARGRCCARSPCPALRPGDRVGGQRRLPVLRDRVRHRADARRGPQRDRGDRDLPAHHERLRPPGRGRAVGAAAGRRGRAAAGLAQRLRAVPDPSVAAGRAATAPPGPRRPAGAGW